ncbi:competence protein CoiA [Rhodoplanes sp. Z2-YC6860]|uniref:competence protein CoiA n=1 Tax=Rhodoplanes sp. Z2-YC6860 TaxID=674703 RepID=UPI00078DA27F|nr:competence protein CoiA family protein [Rhodoplanes sp. Z2-YC6860]AMN40481.1 competence protein [Rhodoplanes sp. Z2-YC6860]
MKFAIIQEQRREAQPGLSGTCPSCKAEVIAKCGSLRVWHWAHRGVRVCDPWWEPETEWHRSWKNEFPADWQEVVHFAQSGEKHIADVKTQSGMIIEFQHSFLKMEEREARELFYRKMVWVVDGRRRKRDVEQLLKCIGRCVWDQPPFILHVTNHAECALLRDWNSSSMPVYFDLGVRQEDGRPIFWRRDPISRNGRTYLTPVSRESFLKVHREGLDAEQQFSEGVSVIVDSLRQNARRAQSQQPPRVQRYFMNSRQGRRF